MSLLCICPKDSGNTIVAYAFGLYHTSFFISAIFNKPWEFLFHFLGNETIATATFVTTSLTLKRYRSNSVYSISNIVKLPNIMYVAFKAFRRCYAV